MTNAVHEFAMRGMSYYISARWSFLAQQAPVCGNLYHHAIEMLLKAQLSKKRSLDQLKGLRHKLVPLWNTFKQDCPNMTLDEFDALIAELGRLEVLRYPDETIEKGMAFQAEWERPNSPPSTSTNSLASRDPTSATQVTANPEPLYFLCINEIDRLVAKIFEASSINPKFYTGLLNPYAQNAIRQNNPVAGDLL